MTRHPTSRRVHRDQTEPDDVVVAKMIEVSTWARQNMRALVIGAIVLAIAIFAGIKYLDYREAMTERASARLLEIRSTAASGNTALAARDLETFVERFGGTPSGEEGRLLLAQLYLLNDEPQKAIDVVRPVVDDGDPLIRSDFAGLPQARSPRGCRTPARFPRRHGGRPAAIRAPDRAGTRRTRARRLPDAPQRAASRPGANGRRQRLLMEETRSAG